MEGFPVQPLASALAATPLVQTQQADQRAKLIRREQNRVKVSSVDQDTLERQVESTDAIDAIHDQDPQQNPRQRQQHLPRDGNEPDSQSHLDITA